MNIITLDATFHAVGSYGLRNNETMRKKTSKYYDESNTAISPIGNSNNLIWSVDTKNYMNSSRMEVWYI